ncbi:MAG: hypothetical protein IOD12_17165 [Silvanigrellales bacterium]|nr:hypothetical protein [Silvanigrellales bacterium]
MTNEALDPVAFLSGAHNDPIDASTVKALVAAFRGHSASELALALEKADALDFAVDPLERLGTPLDAGLIAGLAPRLSVLDVSGRPLRDPEALGELVFLRSLACAECGLADVSWAAGLAALTSLDVSRNHLTTLAPLRATVRLERLKAASNLIDDLDALSPLRQLRFLDVSDNRVRDLSPLQDALRLKELLFRNNGVRSLKPLKDLGELFRVACGGNPLGEDDYDVIPRSVRVE